MEQDVNGDDIQIASQVINSQPQRTAARNVGTTGSGDSLNSASRSRSTNFQNTEEKRQAIIEKGGSVVPGSIRYISRDRVDIRLKSVKELKQAVEAEAHGPLTEVFPK